MKAPKEHRDSDQLVKLVEASYCLLSPTQAGPREKIPELKMYLEPEQVELSVSIWLR